MQRAAKATAEMNRPAMKRTVSERFPGVAVLALLMVSLTLVLGAEEDPWARLQKELAVEGEGNEVGFKTWRALEEQLGEAARRSQDPEIRAKYEFGRFQALTRAAAALPADAAERNASMESWIAARVEEVFYNEIGGNYLVAADRIWALHERSAKTRVAEDIAFLAASTTLGGECEGYLPCTIEATLRTAGRYLELYPQGAHAAEMAGQIYFLSEPPTEAEAELDTEGRAEALTGLGKLRKILEKARFPEQKAYLTHLAALEKVLSTSR